MAKIFAEFLSKLKFSRVAKHVGYLWLRVMKVFLAF